MWRIFLISTLFMLVSGFCYSAELNNRISPKDNVTFLSSYKSGSIDLLKKSDGNSSGKKKYNNFIAFLAKHELLFLCLAIGCTVATGLSLTLGIVGCALFGVYVLGTESLYLPGLALLGVGWSFLFLFLVAAITFWIFYALPKIEKKNARLMEKIRTARVRLETTYDTIALTIKL